MFVGKGLAIVTNILAQTVNNKSIQKLQTFPSPIHTKWAIPFNIRTHPVEDPWNSSGVKGFELGILQG
jgi:hypothetical protein